ncbi:MAG: hypothetical protein M1830_005596 [Pleopsidium flavum]|nr:MAG: hypothetical protein M1830_005596 [Pleopsidium flavum]
MDQRRGSTKTGIPPRLSRLPLPCTTPVRSVRSSPSREKLAADKGLHLSKICVRKTPGREGVSCSTGPKPTISQDPVAVRIHSSVTTFKSNIIGGSKGPNPSKICVRKTPVRDGVFCSTGQKSEIAQNRVVVDIHSSATASKSNIIGGSKGTIRHGTLKESPLQSASRQQDSTSHKTEKQRFTPPRKDPKSEKSQDRVVVGIHSSVTTSKSSIMGGTKGIIRHGILRESPLHSASRQRGSILQNTEKQCSTPPLKDTKSKKPQESVVDDIKSSATASSIDERSKGTIRHCAVDESPLRPASCQQDSISQNTEKSCSTPPPEGGASTIREPVLEGSRLTAIVCQKPSLSLSERTIATLSKLTPPLSAKKRKASFFYTTDSPMRPPTCPAPTLKRSRRSPGVPNRFSKGSPSQEPASSSKR